jgi:hypothetical protein
VTQPILLEVCYTGIYRCQHSIYWEVPQKIRGKLKWVNNEKLEAWLKENEAGGGTY